MCCYQVECGSNEWSSKATYSQWCDIKANRKKSKVEINWGGNLIYVVSEAVRVDEISKGRIYREERAEGWALSHWPSLPSETGRGAASRIPWKMTRKVGEKLNLKPWKPKRRAHQRDFYEGVKNWKETNAVKQTNKQTKPLGLLISDHYQRIASGQRLR